MAKKSSSFDADVAAIIFGFIWVDRHSVADALMAHMKIAMSVN